MKPMTRKTPSRRFRGLWLLPLFLFAFLRGACVTTTNEPDLRTQSFRYYLGIGGNAPAKEHLLRIINGAQTEVVAVFNDLADTDVSSALIARANAGLKVGVAGDRRNIASAGFAALIAQRPAMFQDYFAATAAANAEPNPNLKNNILRTRLNFNRLNRSLKFNASSYDGRVEYNFVVADKYNCWVSTGGANGATFSTGVSIVLVFQSFDICNDFYNEAQQLVYGGLFGDEGVPSFGKFRNNKTITDPNTRFRLGDLIFNIYFAPQERPLTPVITELFRAEKSIRFAARALTQDVINDVATHNANRSHLLNVFQYKARIPQLYGQAFSIQGVVGTEVDTNPSPLSSPYSGSVAYNALVAGTCPTVNSGTIALPFLDQNNAPTSQNVTNVTSIHCDLAALQTSVNDTATFAVRKYPGALPFNTFLVDHNWRKPRAIIMSSDLRKRYYYDDGGSQDAEPKRTRDDFYHITDAFVIIIEPAGSESNLKIFNDLNQMITTLYNAGGSL
jgi:hypothetical protein